MCICSFLGKKCRKDEPEPKETGSPERVGGKVAGKKGD